MGSVHNDLATWAGKARGQGRDTIEITTELADAAAEQIVGLSNKVVELEHQLRSGRSALTEIHDALIASRKDIAVEDLIDIARAALGEA